MNWIDRVVHYVSPTAGMRRSRARLMTEMMQERHYEAASRGRRTKGWRTLSTDANTAARNLQLIRDRSRDLVRNNPWASRAVSVITNNTVGWGIHAKITGPKRLETFWEEWAERVFCDADGQLNIYGLQQLVLRTAVESGSALVRRRWRRPEDGLPLPLQLQILEPDYLDNSKDGQLRNGHQVTGRIIDGIEFDAIGRRVAYHLFRRHPGDATGWQNESVRVPADDVLHIYRVDRPGQVNGVPWAAPIIIKLRDLDEYEDAYLLRQKIANLFAAFVTDQEGDPSTAASYGEKLEPGSIEILPPGRNVEFATPPRTDGYGNYTRDVMRAVAAGFGITYESLTGDYSQVNFSSARMGGQEMGRNIESWRWQMLIPQFCGGTWRWFLEAAELMGVNTSRASVNWTPPARILTDPAREYPAIRDAVRSGLLTLPEAIREQGYDPEQMLQEMAENAKMLDKLGLSLDTDPRRDKAPLPLSNPAEED